jgi:glycosyltransferase involved in cell wall biosynthesis
MEYVVIMPAHNEEQYIEQAIESLVTQSVLPARLVVVNDGSTDNTGKIVAGYAQRYAWISVVDQPVKAGRSIGQRVIEAFQSGLDSIGQEYDIIVKMDADVVLPANYFQVLKVQFSKKPRLGIAGGVLMVGNRLDSWKEELIADRSHVKGCCKTYRRKCLKDIGGLKKSIGWDTVDELLARYHGWDVLVVMELTIKHQRKMGTLTNPVKLNILIGRGMYRMRYGFLLTLLSALKATWIRRPSCLPGIFIPIGWIIALVNGDNFMVSKDEGKFIRRLRSYGMRSKIKQISGWKIHR